MSIQNSTFENNQATQQGGAVYYNFKRPTIGDDVIYTNNSSPYGENIASYAVKITFEDSTSSVMDIQDLGPGIRYDQPLKFAVRDYDDQVMVLDSQSQILIVASDSSVAEVKGFNINQLNKGVASFDNFVVNTNPGNKDISLEASTKSIDQLLVRTVFGNTISNNTITTSFRYCQPGERILGEI